MVKIREAEIKKDRHIQVHDLRVTYGGNEILHGLNLTINRGEFVSIVGKSGSGKSTLLHALAGFIEFGGMVLMSTEFGMVFQNYAVFPWLTVEENIAFGLHELESKKKQEVVNQHLEMVGLTTHGDYYPGQLSGGQVQRVAIARALAPGPEILFMDEPFGALDIYTREKMQKWLLDIWEKNHKTVLFVTHNIEEAIFLSDRVILVGQGKIIDEYKIQIERPRKEEAKFTHEFVELRKEILEIMEAN